MALIVLPIWTTSAAGTPQPGHLTSTVKNALNAPLPEVTITIRGPARFVAGNLGTFRTEARLSGPIVRDRIMGSAAILRGVRDGFVRDLNHPDHSLGGEDVTAVRSKLLVVFNARSNLIVAGDMTHQDPIPLTYAKVLVVKPGFQVDRFLHTIQRPHPAASSFRPARCQR